MQKNKPSHCYTRFFIGEHSASPSPLPRPREGRSWFRPHSIQGKVTCSVGDSAQDASSPNLQVGTGLSIEHFRVSGEHLGFLWSTLAFHGASWASALASQTLVRQLLGPVFLLLSQAVTQLRTQNRVTGASLWVPRRCPVNPSPVAPRAHSAYTRVNCSCLLETMESITLLLCWGFPHTSSYPTLVILTLSSHRIYL